MRMSSDFFESHDFDWFALDRSGKLLHFANGGQGPLPDVFKQDFEFYELVFDFFCKLKASVSGLILSGNIPALGEANITRYAMSFLEFANKGLYSYDYIGSCYKIIAAPEVEVSIALAPEFKKIPVLDIVAGDLVHDHLIV